MLMLMILILHRNTISTLLADEFRCSMPQNHAKERLPCAQNHLLAGPILLTFTQMVATTQKTPKNPRSVLHTPFRCFPISHQLPPMPAAQETRP